MRVIRILVLLLTVLFLDLHQAWCETPALNITSALKSYSEKDYPKVITELSSKVDKLDRRGLLILSKSYSATGNHLLALKTYSTQLSLDLKDIEAKAEIGHEQAFLSKDKEALVTLKEALDLNPKYEKTYLYLAEIYERRKNRYELRQTYQDLIEKFGEQEAYLKKICEIMTNDALYDMSFNYCNKGVEKYPKVPEFYVYLGTAYKETANLEKAEKNFKVAADRFSDSYLSQISYAKYLDDKKKFVTSYSYYAKAIKIQPESYKALEGYANAAFEIQKYDEALEVFTKACQINRNILPSFRKAEKTLRTTKQNEFEKKYQLAIDDCSYGIKTDL